MTDPTGNFSYPPQPPYNPNPAKFKPYRESVPYNPFTLLAAIIVALVVLCLTGCLGIAFLGTGPSEGMPTDVVTPSLIPTPAP